MQRFGILTKLKPGMAEQYRRLHDEIWDEVVQAAYEANMRNFTIFQYGEYLFSYYEYVGKDFELDMRKKNSLPISQKWQEACKECFEPFEHGSQQILEEIFHNDFDRSVV